MEWIVAIIAIVIASAFFGAKKSTETNSHSGKEYNSHEKPTDDGVLDAYYYDTYVKTISLYKRKGYVSRPLVGMKYRNLSTSDLGKFEGYAWAENDNEFDDYAVSIVSAKGTRIGYIPRDDYEMHENITGNLGASHAYGYVAYSESDGYYGEVCIEYLSDDLIDN